MRVATELLPPVRASRSATIARLQVDARWFPAVRRAIASLSRRGMRLGTGPIELRELQERDGQVEVEIRGAAPQLAGYRVVATLHHEGGETAVEAVPGERLDERRWARAEPWCEHCAVRRRRHVTYLLRRGGSAPIQVGSACLADFTGERDPVRAARQAQLLGQAAREVERARGAEVGQVPADTVVLEEFMACVATVASSEGFRSRRRAEESGERASADAAWEAVGAEPPAREAVREAARIVRWAREELAERGERGEYEERLVWALSRPRLSFRPEFDSWQARGVAADPLVERD